VVLFSRRSFFLIPRALLTSLDEVEMLSIYIIDGFGPSRAESHVTQESATIGIY
jgi:hypothetical protein